MDQLTPCIIKPRDCGLELGGVSQWRVLPSFLCHDAKKLGPSTDPRLVAGTESHPFLISVHFNVESTKSLVLAPIAPSQCTGLLRSASRRLESAEAVVSGSGDSECLFFSNEGFPLISLNLTQPSQIPTPCILRRQSLSTVHFASRLREQADR
jgi:hypothetical protein